jgi:hypothetical protein
MHFISKSIKSCLKKEGSVLVQPKKVWFNQIIVLEFPIILGDNPTPIDGIPITIGWEPQKMSMMDIHSFELSRPAPRTRAQLRLSAVRRVEMVLLGGCSEWDIGNTRIMVADIQCDRAKSSQKGGWERLFEKMIKLTSKDEQYQVKVKRDSSDTPAVLQGCHNGVDRESAPRKRASFSNILLSRKKGWENVKEFKLENVKENKIINAAA